MISRKRTLSLAAKAKKMKRQQLKVHHDQLQNITQTWCLFAVKTSCWCVPMVRSLHLADPRLTAAAWQLSIIISVVIQSSFCSWIAFEAGRRLGILYELLIWDLRLFCLKPFILLYWLLYGTRDCRKQKPRGRHKGRKKYICENKGQGLILKKKHFCSSHKKSCNDRL